MTKWECSKCPFGHNSEVVMIHHQITEHDAVYSDERLKQVGYYKYLKRLKTEGKLITKPKTTKRTPLDIRSKSRKFL